jgi:DNA-binding protein H-NS
MTIVTLLKDICHLGDKLLETLNIPDINIDELINYVSTSMDDAKKMVPRCEEAFKVIINSKDMLKKNFGKYYQDSVAGGNSGIIIEEFLADVSTTAGDDRQHPPKIMRQFNQILSFYNKNTRDLNPEARAKIRKYTSFIRSCDTSGSTGPEHADGEHVDAEHADEEQEFSDEELPEDTLTEEEVIAAKHAEELAEQQDTERLFAGDYTPSEVKEIDSFRQMFDSYRTAPLEQTDTSTDQTDQSSRQARRQARGQTDHRS